MVRLMCINHQSKTIMKTTIITLAVLLGSIGTQAHNNQLTTAITHIEKTTHLLPPLSLAVVKGDVETVKKFIEYGADVNETNEQGVTPLMFAARYNRVDMMQLLLSNGAKKDAKDNQGVSVLEYAERSQAKEAILLLQKK